MIPSKKIQEELPALKKLVQNTNTYNNHNYERFNEFRKFVYETSITQKEKDINLDLNRPNIEANVTTAYISRLCGEFSKQEPSIEVSAEEGAQVNPAVIEFVENHARHILDEAKQSNTQYHTYRDSLSGGFGVMKVFTDYQSPKSFKQCIKIRKCKYPTLCGFDPYATEPHKGDGNYAFECYPMTKADFKSKYTDIDIDGIKFSGSDNIGGFSWSFNTGQDDVLLLCNMIKKKKKRTKILEIADGQCLTEKEYKDFSEKWLSSGKLEQVPAVINSRYSNLETICQYVFIETMMLEYRETDYNNLNIIFADGDSIELYENKKGSIKEFNRPFVYNTKGAQQLKNLGLQALANYLESICQHKFIVMKEAIPEESEYMRALTEPQKSNTIVVNSMVDNDPNKMIPNPIIPLQPQSCPPEVSATIGMADQIIQNELGSYDAALGINNNQLSGIAIVEAATQSQAAAMPYVVNYMCALNQAAVIIVDLIPKYYKTPMTVPIIDREGKRSYQRINDQNNPNSIDVNYDSNVLNIRVTAGVNFAIQKARALQQIIALCQASPGFAKFMEMKGLKVLVDNIEIRGADILKDLAEKYLEEMQMQQQQAQAMQQQMMQNNPQMLDQKTKQFNAMANAKLKEKELQIKEQELELKGETIVAQHDAAIARAHAEEVRANADIHIKTHDMDHRHHKELVETVHKVHESHGKHKSSKKESENERT